MNSNGRILTTHVGSLPRPDDLVEIMFAQEDGIHVGTAGVDPDVVWAKLAVLAGGAERASRKLWPRR